MRAKFIRDIEPKDAMITGDEQTRKWQRILINNNIQEAKHLYETDFGADNFFELMFAYMKVKGLNDKEILIDVLNKACKQSFEINEGEPKIEIDEDQILIDIDIQLEYAGGLTTISLTNNDDEDHTVYLDVEHHGKFGFDNTDDKDLNKFGMNELYEQIKQWEMETYDYEDRQYYDNL